MIATLIIGLALVFGTGHYGEVKQVENEKQVSEIMKDSWERSFNGVTKEDDSPDFTKPQFGDMLR